MSLFDFQKYDRKEDPISDKNDVPNITKYYRKNREKLLAARRKRYRNDPEYRLKQSLYVRQYEAKKKIREIIECKANTDDTTPTDTVQIEEEEFTEEKNKRRNRIHRIKNRKTILKTYEDYNIKHSIYAVEIGDVVVELKMYKIKDIAKMLERTIYCVQKWESEGIFPHATYRTSYNVKLYTELQMKIILTEWNLTRELYGEDLMKKLIGNTDFFDRLRDEWEKYPNGIDDRDL